MKACKPPHLYLDNLHYFITCRTFDRLDFFAGDCAKKILRRVINESASQLRINLIAYVILDNHYHLLIFLKRGKVLPRLMQLINGRSSRRLKRLYTTEGRLKSFHTTDGRLISIPSDRLGISGGRGLTSNKLISLPSSSYHTKDDRLISLSSGGQRIWHNYWEHGIRDEADFWRHFNYIHHNPIKHRYVKKMEDYEFSSYNYWLKRKGSDWLNSCFETYPILDYTPNRSN